jgi:hypothetical protein
MQKQGSDYTRDRERALAEGMKDVASELRLVDPADFVAFIRTDQYGNIRNLVNSSTEMFFKPGTIQFGLSGEADLDWNSCPSIALDMEFHHYNVAAYFRLILESMEAGIEISYVSFEGGSSDPDANTERLIEALADARLPSKRSRLGSRAGAGDAGEARSSPG